MTFAIIGCVAGIFLIEYLGKTFSRTRFEKTEVSGVAIACEIKGHTYVVSAPDAETACQAWAAYAADEECNFTWWDCAKMNRLTREFCKCKQMHRRAK